jgi:diaminopropionate ammonia-lyase
MFKQYKNANAHVFAAHPPLGPEVVETLSRTDFDRAEAEITSWEGYKPTPIFDLSVCARRLNIQAIHYKHEGPRFGLGSFKALGGAYAVLRALQRVLSTTEGREITVDEIRSGHFASQMSTMTIISATDGNHGRSVAWGAKRFGAKCRIYIHAEVSEFRAEALQDLSAEVIRIDGDYDATVAQTRVDAEEFGWMIVSDTSWPGYSQAPLDLMAGYGLMAREIVRELPEPPTHVFLQGGVGGLAASVIAAFNQEWGKAAPLSVVVEPELAPCLFASAKAKAPVTIKIEEETLMAGLSCGEPSQIAWAVLENAVRCFMTIPDSLVAPTLRMLARGQIGNCNIEAGESAVAGLIGLICGATNASLRDILNLDSQSRVMIIGSEGITDPSVFQDIMAD